MEKIHYDIYRHIYDSDDIQKASRELTAFIITLHQTIVDNNKPMPSFMYRDVE